MKLNAESIRRILGRRDGKFSFNFLCVVSACLLV
jgi:hypothetical protein